MISQTLKASTIDDITEAYERAHGPFEVCVDGQANFVIMRASDLEGEAPLDEAEGESLLAGYQDYLDGNVVGAREMLAQIRTEYGLHEPPLNDAQREMILEDYAAAKRGETVDADVALEEIRHSIQSSEAGFERGDYIEAREAMKQIRSRYEPPLSEEEIASLRAGLDDVKSGRVYDFYECLDEIDSR